MTAQPTKALETFPNPNPNRDFHIHMEIPEFTCLCPKTGQPDFAHFKIEIVADRGLTRHVPQATWDRLVDSMRSAFREGRFEEGLMQAVEAVDTLLLQRFAVAEDHDNPNELPDRPDIR